MSLRARALVLVVALLLLPPPAWAEIIHDAADIRAAVMRMGAALTLGVGLGLAFGFVIGWSRGRRSRNSPTPRWTLWVQARVAGLRTRLVLALIAINALAWAFLSGVDARVGTALGRTPVQAVVELLMSPGIVVVNALQLSGRSHAIVPVAVLGNLAVHSAAVLFVAWIWRCCRGSRQEGSATAPG